MSWLEQKIAVAVFLMKRASPLPLDLETELLANGVDVAYLNELHRN